jgi:hypothetical protein
MIGDGQMDILKEAYEGIVAAKEMFDALADEGLDYDDRCWPPDQCIQYAIAAALIAIAERKPQFVQIGPVVFDPSTITAVVIVPGDSQVVVYFGDKPTRFFHNKERDAFLAWWEKHADVVRLDVSDALDTAADL